MSPRAIDLSCDLGEDPGQRALDEALLGIVTSANVACGGHAGDEASMRALARLCLEHGVALGAHPSYPDREGFGRRELDLEPSAIEHAVFEQVHALAEQARAEGVTLTHVKPHGALYHATNRRFAVAMAVARAAEAVHPDLVLVAPVASPALTLWRSMGRHVAAEAFADRRYGPDGHLLPRSAPDALLAHPAEAAEQALRLARGLLRADGTPLPMQADTLCVHSDTPGALAIAQAVRARLDQEHVPVRALPRSHAP